MRTRTIAGILSSGLLLASAPALADDPIMNPGRTPSTVAVYGDAPYGTNPIDTAEFQLTPAFIDNINADPDVALVMHVGDIHSGKQYCTQAYDQSIFDLWQRFQDPLVYTPGDNEWADCHKTGEGGGAYSASLGHIVYVLDADGNPADYANGDPLANLALVRSIFFPIAGVTLGQNPKLVLSQALIPSPAHPTDQDFIENVMWVQSHVLFVAINLPGGSNNDADIWYGTPATSDAQRQEPIDRDGADLRWLDLAFTIAQFLRLDGVVIMAQADMWDPEKGAAHQTNYEPYVSSIAAHATQFGKPVLMFNGDSHVYQSGNPMSPGNPVAAMHPGYNVPNFHRIVVHGSTLPLEWLKLTIDPRRNAPRTDTTFGPFSWQRMIVQ